MALLLHVASGASLPLRARTGVGRAPSCHVHIPRKQTSGEHALITYAPEVGWTIRDLGSRNGTLVDGRPLTPGTRAPLAVGTLLCFGASTEEWRLESIDPPAVMATDGTVWVEGEDDLLGLPDLDDPALVIQGTPIGWFCADEPVHDGQVLSSNGRDWTLCLPSELSATASHGTALVKNCSLQCNVSADEEFIQVHVGLPDGTVELPPRSHHEVLLVLARRRLSDADEAAIGPIEQGWMYRADLQKALRASANQIYIGLHRLRKEFEALGIIDGHDVIEARRTTRQVRLAIDQLTVQSMS